MKTFDQNEKINGNISHFFKKMGLDRGRILTLSLAIERIPNHFSSFNHAVFYNGLLFVLFKI